MDIIIGKDIRTYKVKDIGPLSLREALSCAAAAACSYGVYAVEKIYLDSIIVIPMMIAAVPALIVGFVRIYGLSIEQYIKTAFVENFTNPKIRLYECDMKYSVDEIEDMCGLEATQYLLMDEKEKKNMLKAEEKKSRKQRKRLSKSERTKMKGYR